MSDKILSLGDTEILAAQLRADSIRASTAIGLGHPTSAMSAADIVAVLVARHFRYDWNSPGVPNNDSLILSKGHASTLYYAALKAAGVIDDSEFMTYRRFGSRLEGHATPRLPWVDVATGSLGQGLPIGVGMAVAARNLGRPCHIWVLCGDGELAEGSMWEAIALAGSLSLPNLTAIIDMNGWGQTGPTAIGKDGPILVRRMQAFGWDAIPINGHNIKELDKEFGKRRRVGQTPTVFVAETIKGKGFPEVEDRRGWHGRAFSPEMAERALDQLRSMRASTVPRIPSGVHPEAEHRKIMDSPISNTVGRYAVGDVIPIRQGFGQSLASIGDDAEDVFVIDADVSSSTYTSLFAERYPDRFLQVGIAEQLMIGAAIGLATKGYRPVVASFAAFLTRGHDFLRMAAISRSRICVIGTHAGVEIGEDGPSQMGLEDLAMMRSIPESVVLYPSDGNAAGQLLRLALGYNGISYLRVTRGEYPVLYNRDIRLRIGGSRTVLGHGHDLAVLFGAGATLHTCLAVGRRLEGEGTHVRVVDIYSIKPIDTPGVVGAITECGGRAVIVEDHYPEGGLGSAILSNVAAAGIFAQIQILSVDRIPISGSKGELMEYVGISENAVLSATRKLVGGT